MMTRKLKVSLIIVLFFVRCGAKLKKTEECNRKVNDIITNRDTSNKKSDSISEITNTDYEKDWAFFNDTLSNPLDFDFDLKNTLIDSIYQKFKSKLKCNVVKVKPFDLEGDSYYSAKRYLKCNSNEELYLFKIDGGEYGFNNYQCFLKNDSLSIVRQFLFSPEIKGKDGKIIVTISEIIYFFNQKEVVLKERKEVCEPNNYNSFFDMKYDEKSMLLDSTYNLQHKIFQDNKVLFRVK